MVIHNILMFRNLAIYDWNITYLISNVIPIKQLKKKNIFLQVQVSKQSNA